MLRKTKKALLARLTLISHSFKQKYVNTPRFKVPHLENDLNLKRIRVPWFLILMKQFVSLLTSRKQLASNAYIQLWFLG